MQLKTVLKENAMLTFRDLSSFQIAMVKKIADGNFDLDNLMPKDWAIMDQLQDLGLIDAQYNLTPVGSRAAELGKKFGSTDLRRARETDKMLGRTGSPAHSYSNGNEMEGEEITADEPGSFQNRWGDIRDRDD